MEFQHTPVLLQETLKGLNIQGDGTYVDCTVGGGGHSKEIVKALTSGRLIAIDQDVEALDAAKVNLAPWAEHVRFVHANFKDLDHILVDLSINRVEGILMDIGVSSYQLDQGERGFSYHQDAELDMRMDRSADIPTAKDILKTYSKEDLSRIIYEYGEDRWADRIATFIVEARKNRPIENTADLVDIIKRAVPKGARLDKHPARQVFQALRIEVNHELDVLAESLQKAVNRLEVGGRLCVIDFHSLEDRIVKNAFKQMATGCICPPDFPVCVCGHHPEIKWINRKPIEASSEEAKSNPRARSAKLRIVEKLGDNNG
ncbi:16S rRNA (cytosine(1402)-N(4))-methyltransferase RsmH [Kallipyga gabonensis]|uniref:16S rRNA (cytosine(1402)-N(4))-methyltransferase RsmH n=1 Tax=Kallipyga gabonensis TaxID=1686287 RepID=UPI0006B4619E|nr:16S rRNA (cytosine(1402)-N(4))-methyltransferase RsmH [Kallipyga gabonensis]